MKALIFLSFFYFSVAAFAQSVSHSIKSIDKYPENTANTIYIPSTFSKETLVSEFTDQLAGKTIKRIDLVYTRYKSSPSFDQKALNNARTEQFRKNYPGIIDQVTEINWVEQTGATKRNEAAGYFHGFVVFYEEPLTVEKKETTAINLRDYFRDAGNEGTTFTLNNNRDTTLYCESGTVLKIAAGSVKKANDEPVYGSFTIVYKEFRNPAEITLSGIPMTFEKNGLNYNFNSAGMFEIKGYQNNEELKLTKPLTVDFNCTETLPDLSFYQLDNRTNRWKELRKIEWAKAKVVQPLNNQNRQRGKHKKNRERLKRHGNNTKQRGFFYWLFHHKSYKNQRINIINADIGNDPVPNDIGSTLLAEGTNTGHTYPAQVRGLNCPEFGVYNCDQIFRVGTPVAIQPKYIDQESGKSINNPFVACLIDRNINGSFSFDPSMIQFNSEAKNILLLFTKDQKVFALDSDAFAQLNLKETHVELRMKEITDQAATSDDLKKYLNL